MRWRSSVSRSSTDFSRSRFSLPEYYTPVSTIAVYVNSKVIGQGIYPGRHLLPPRLVLRIIRLAKDIIPLILDPRGIIVPVGALITSLCVNVHPDLGRRGNEHPWSNARDRAWLY